MVNLSLYGSPERLQKGVEFGTSVHTCSSSKRSKGIQFGRKKVRGQLLQQQWQTKLEKREDQIKAHTSMVRPLGGEWQRSPQQTFPWLLNISLALVPDSLW